MSTPWFRLFALFSIILVAQAALFIPGNPPEKKRYTILTTSKLYLKGTSNVNNFTCTCQDRFPSQVLEVDNTGGQSRFKNTRLRMKTKKFNCKNAKIDRDMHKALKADEYDYIIAELVETTHNPDHVKDGNSGNWFAVKAKVKLTITNVTKEHVIQAVAKKSSDNRFSLRGEKVLFMSEFGIDPPEALFGLIKVNDQITFYFDLDLSVEDVAE